MKSCGGAFVRPFVFVLGMLAALPAWSQSTGRVLGIVKDQQDLPVQGATVSLFRPSATEPELQTKTAGDGSFAFDSVNSLNYTLKVEGDKFKTAELSVKVSPAGEVLLTNIKLELGTTAERVQVEGAEALVQSGNAEITTTLSSDQLDRLPLPSRNPLTLVLTQPGISNNGGLTTINGLRVPYDNFSLDGISIQDNFVRSNGLNFSPNRPSLGEVFEFTIVTSNGSSTYGNGGTQIALVPRSGTNEYHGSLYAYNSNNLWNANGWFASAAGRRNQDKLNQAGGTFGGPMAKNKLYFFTNYELLREAQDIPASITVPSLAARQGDFSYVSGGQIITTNVLKPLGLTVDPAVQSLLARFPAPNGTIIPLSGLGIYAANRSFRDDRDNLITRFDYVPSSKKLSVTATYAWNQERVDRGGTSFGGPRPPVFNDDTDNFLSMAARLSLSARFTNEVRGGFNRAPASFTNRDLLSPYQVRVPSCVVGGTACSTGNIPVTTIGATDLPQGRFTNTYGFQDNAAWGKGNHDIRFGFQTQLIRVRKYDVNELPTVDLGSFQVALPDSAFPAPISTSARAAANQLAATLAGRVLGYTQRFNVLSQSSGYLPYTDLIRRYGYDNYSLYIQDNWRVRPNLTLTLGLRYEYYPVLNEDNGLLLAPKLAGGNVVQSLYASTGTFVFSNGAESQSPYKPDRNNFAPNVGLAWSPFRGGKTVVRAAYSVSYLNDDTITVIDLALGNNAGLSPRFSRLVDNGTTLNQAQAGLNSRTSPIAAPNYTGTFGFSPANFQTFATAIDPNLRTPYVQQWSIGVQHQIQRYLIDVKYVGNHATKMLRDANLGDVGTAPSVFYTTMLGNFSNSTYNALQINVIRRLSKGFAVQANYTYSQNYSDSAFSRGFEPYRDTTDSAADRARTLFDLPHSFKANFIYDLPFGKGKRFATPFDPAFAGWSFSGLITAQSGNPFSILSTNSTPSAGFGNNTGIYNTANAAASLDGIVRFAIDGSGPTIAPNGTANLLSRPATDTLGNLKYRAFTGPGFYDVDLGIQKKVRLTEHQNVEFRAEAFNLLNHPSFFVSDQYVEDGTSFGRRVSQTGTSRRVQVALYYRF